MYVLSKFAEDVCYKEFHHLGAFTNLLMPATLLLLCFAYGTESNSEFDDLRHSYGAYSVRLQLPGASISLLIDTFRMRGKNSINMTN